MMFYKSALVSRVMEKQEMAEAELLKLGPEILGAIELAEHFEDIRAEAFVVLNGMQADVDERREMHAITSEAVLPSAMFSRL